MSEHVLCGMQADNLVESLLSLRRAASGLEPVGRLLRSQALATRNQLRSPDVVPHAVGTVSAETGELRILLADMSVKPGSQTLLSVINCFDSLGLVCRSCSR